MAIVNQPTPLSNELAWNGDKNPIPDTNDGSKGLFSVEYGFPYVTQQPLAQGGIPPQRNDFNGVLNLLSKFIRYFQNGGVFAYSSAMDYSVGMLVRNGDRLYVCKAENGANTSAGVQNISNSNYWNEITLEDTLGDTLINQLKTVLVTEAEVANNTTDWNSLTESRTYKISGATFSATYHQPVGANGNGELVVLKNGTDTIVQVYYANSTQPDQAGAFHRIYFGGAWTNWVYDITNQGGTINGNLNVDGNLGVTGNSNINGKLTVQNIEVSEGLTIGGAPPLKQDAIDKLQAQIIAPSQVLYVDQKNGNDNNDGTTQATAVRTLDKAVSLITKNIPTLTINLTTYTEPENQIYNTFTISEPINNNKLQVDTFRLVGTWDTYRTEHIIAKIIVPYGKVKTGVADYSSGSPVEYYQWGRFFIEKPINVYLQSVMFEFSDDTLDKDKYRNSIFYGLSKSYEMRDCYSNTMTLKDNCSIINVYGMTNIDIIHFNLSSGVTITGTSLIIDDSNSKRYKTDPKTNPDAEYVAGDTAGGLITKYITNDVNFTGNTLGSTKGLPAKTNAIYTQGFD